MNCRFSILLVRLFVVVVALLLQQRCAADMTPSAPVRHFRMPRFGKDGYKVWDFSGREGHYISREHIEVIDMTLRVFSGDARGVVETQIKSPEAVLFIQRSYAHSPQQLSIEGIGYHVEGRDWIWDGKQKKIIVQEDVHVVFDQRLQIL